MKRAFTLIELLFVIVIIGVLASVAVPKLAGLTDNAKVSAEVATASSVQGAIDAVHAQWITNRCDFMWGPNGDQNSSTTINTSGYPVSLGANLENVLKNVNDWSCTSSGANMSQCRGPASSATKGVGTCKPNKPCKTKYWEYDATSGTFSLKS